MTSGAQTEALARTILLSRDYLMPEASDEDIAQALCDTRVTFVADREALANRNSVDALVTGVLLCARSGARIALEIDDVPISGFHAPLTGSHLGPALLDVCDDLIPGTTAFSGCWTRPPDLRVIIGESHSRGIATQTVRACGGTWVGELRPGSDAAEPFARVASPFGALTAAGLVSGEVYKIALRKLRRLARDRALFDEQFAPVRRATVALAPTSTPPPVGQLGPVDVISGGAIAQCALYALGRVPNVSGSGRLFEPERADVTNLNRYALLRRSRLGKPKATDIAAWFVNTELRLAPIEARFDDSSIGATELIAPTVLVGVDHIPSRWLADVVARRREQYWLGIGATTHFSAMASFHVPGLPCARCLHPMDDEGPPLIPTVSFVSHWAGLYLASLVARHASGEAVTPASQTVFASLLRPDLSGAVWWSPVAPRSRCAIGCSLAA